MGGLQGSINGLGSNTTCGGAQQDSRGGLGLAGPRSGQARRAQQAQPIFRAAGQICDTRGMLCIMTVAAHLAIPARNCFSTADKYGLPQPRVAV